MNSSGIGRSRWAAIGAAVAVCLGAGGIGITQAAVSDGELPIYRPIEPCRLLDTRAEYKVGAQSTLAAGDITFAGWGDVGNCELPSDTAGLSLNVTAVSPTLPTFLTLYPTGTTRSDASHLNPVPGDFATPNAVNVDLSAADGQFNVYNLQGNVDLIIDVVGLYIDHNHDEYPTREEVDAMITTGGSGDYYTEGEVDDLLDDKADEANLPFAVASEPIETVLLGNAVAPAQIVRSVTVDAPVAGSVLLNYSSYIVPSNTADPAWTGCSVGTAMAIDLETPGASVVTGIRSTVGGTRVIDVEAGSMTFHLVCDTLAGTSGTGSTQAAHPSLTALYTTAP